MLSLSALPRLNKMPSAKVCPMKCSPDCRQSECNSTPPASTIRKQSNSSCSSTSVSNNTATINSNHSNNLNSGSIGGGNHSTAINHNSIINSNSNGNNNGNSLSNSIIPFNNPNGLNSNQSNLIYESNLSSLDSCAAIKHSNLLVCTKACCTKNAHSNFALKHNSTRHPPSTANNSFCACCSPAVTDAALRTGLRLHTSATKCTDQCFLTNKQSSNSFSNQYHDSSNQITALNSNSQANSQTKSNNAMSNQIHCDLLSSQSPQTSQIEIDNDKAFKANSRASFSAKSMTSDYYSIDRCSTAHVPLTSSSSSNCKQLLKCALTSMNETEISELVNSGNHSNNSNSKKSKCMNCNISCPDCVNSCNGGCNYADNFNGHLSNKTDACYAGQHRSNRKIIKQQQSKSTKNQPKFLKSSTNESTHPNQQHRQHGTCYRNDKYSDKHDDNGEKYRDRCHQRYSDKYIESYNERHNHKINERCADRYERCYIEKQNENSGKHSDKYSEKCTVNHCNKNLENKCASYKCSDKCQNNCQNAQNYKEKWSVKINNDKCNDDKQPIEKLPIEQQLIDRQTNKYESTPYEKVMSNLKKRTKQRIDRKEEADKNPYVGMYRLRKEIGNGNFSQVHIGTHCLTKDRVAIKVLKRDKLDSKTQKMLLREISAMDCLHHPHVVRLFEVIETFSKIYLVMEYAHGGELYQKVHQERRLNERVASYYFAQIISAIDHLSENIFFSDKTYTTVKIGDFGFANQVTSSSQFLNTYCGSPPFASPELFASPEVAGYHGPSVDLWALGVLLYFMVTGNMPFNADSVPKLKKIILEGEYHMPHHVSEECQFVIKGLLKHLPQNRLTIQQIKQTKFLQSRRFSEPLPSYALRKQKINSDQLLNSSNLRASSALHLMSTNDCCKYAKRPVSDGGSYAQMKKKDDNYYNYKIAPMIVQSKQSEPQNSTLISDYKQKQQEDSNSEAMCSISHTNNKGNLSPQSDSGHCDESDSCCKSVENQPLEYLKNSINSTTKLNLHYYNDQQYYPSQAVNYQGIFYNKSKPEEEDSGVFKSENSPKISFKSIENVNTPPEHEEASTNPLINLNSTHLRNLDQLHTNHLNNNNNNNSNAVSKEEIKTLDNAADAFSTSTAIVARRLSDNKLSADEQETLKRLKQFGISEKMLGENVDSGVRNSLIGIYRLVLHNVIETRLAREKEEFREAKRKQKFKKLKQNTVNNNKNQIAAKVTTMQVHSVLNADNPLRKSASNGQFYEDDQTHQQSQLISSKSNRMHFSMNDGLDSYSRVTKDDEEINELNEMNDSSVLTANKLVRSETNQTINDLNNLRDAKESKQDLRYSSSEDENCSILSSSEEEDKNLDEINVVGGNQDRQTGNRKQNLFDHAVGQRNFRNFNEESTCNEQYPNVSHKRNSKNFKLKTTELNELNDRHMINEHHQLGTVRDPKIEDEDYQMKCDFIDSHYGRAIKVADDNSMIVNTNNNPEEGANLCEMKTNLMNEIATTDHQPFKPYLNNYLKEEKRWKKHQKKKKKLRKRSVISCCVS